MGRNSQKRRQEKARYAAARQRAQQDLPPPTEMEQYIHSEAGRAFAEFERAAKFQQMTSEVVSHTEESIDHLEPFEGEEWADRLLEMYRDELPVLREFYANVRRYTNMCGHSVIDRLDPRPGALKGEDS